MLTTAASTGNLMGHRKWVHLPDCRGVSACQETCKEVARRRVLRTSIPKLSFHPERYIQGGSPQDIQYANLAAGACQTTQDLNVCFCTRHSTLCSPDHLLKEALSKEARYVKRYKTTTGQLPLPQVAIPARGKLSTSPEQRW